ncbi:hypothetical protein [Agrobacterium tumefaciens]|uniref:hypothetical protein n=1 Tax=Agrobacterium tumefaciens TaxID=358 RepID=UPI0015746D77|nr:hypothetical protein [Agrobacterium tumefaciens]NSX94407.1 hypothetical protein [Agrobacterium tumefaciens]
MKKHMRLVLGTAVLSGSILLGSNSAFAFWCSVSTGWIATHEQVEKHLIDETQILENDVAKAGSETLEQVLAALKVYNRQNSGEGQRLQQSTKKSQEAYANTVTEQMRRERLVEIKENYSYESGQGPNACAQVAFMQKVTGAIDGTGSSTSRTYKAIDVAPGSVPSVAQQAADRRDPRSTDASLLLDVSASEEDKRKVIQQLAGFAVAKPGGDQDGTVGGEFAMLRAREAEAWRSPALVSLAAVAAMSNKATGDGDGAGSVLQAMDALIDNYGGGPAYAKWTNALQLQSERGLMIELNRLRALSMRLRTYHSESEARKAAVVAGMLAAEAQGSN